MMALWMPDDMVGMVLAMMREKVEEGKRTPNEFYDLLFDRYPGDNTVNNKEKTREGGKIATRKKQKVWL